MIGLQAVRQPDAPRAGDARDGPGPAGRPADGRRPQPDDRDDVPDRRRAGRRGRRVPGPVLRLRPVRPRLQRRPQGVHGGGARRDRQPRPARRSAASSSPSSRSSPQAIGQARWSQAIVFVVLIVVLVFRPAGHPRPADRRAGMTAATAAPGDRARAARIGCATSPNQHRSITIIIAMAIVAAAAADPRDRPAVQHLPATGRLDRRLLERRRLRPAGARPEHRGRPGRPARPRLRGVLRDRRLHLRLRRVAVLRASTSRSC